MVKAHAAAMLLAVMTLHAQAQSSGFVASASGQPALRVDGKPFLILGIQLNNSSGFPAEFHRLAPAIARTRHLIELGGLVAKAELIELSGDDRAMLYGAFLAIADRLQSEDRERLFALWKRKGKQAFDLEGSG